jgi:hypothetical protein
VGIKCIKIGGRDLEVVCPGALRDITGDGDVEYADEYWQKYVSYSETERGKRIAEFRKSVADSFFGPGKVLDWGCGHADCVRSDTSGRWYGYDVNPLCSEGLGDRWDSEPQVEEYPGVCFFDSLEHHHDPGALLARCSHEVIVSIPVYSGPVENLPSWRHWRPREHYLYCTSHGFELWAYEQGFQTIGVDWTEMALGRNDIAVFKLVRFRNRSEQSPSGHTTLFDK